MTQLRLISPNGMHKESFLEFVLDVKNTGYESYELYTKAEVNFGAFVNDLLDAGEGKNLPEGWVPCSSYWLIDAYDEIIGVTRIRHRVDSDILQTMGHIGYEIKSSQRNKGYGSKILQLALREAKKIGLDEVLITCDDDNYPSIRIIEKHKGEFIKPIYDEQSGKTIRQYLIRTT